MKKLTLWMLGVGIALMVTLTACSASSPAPSQAVAPQMSSSTAASGRAGYPATITATAPAMAPSANYGADSAAKGLYPAPAPTATSLPVSPVSQAALPSDRMVVRNGNMQLVVKDVPASLDQVVKLANDLKGFVVNSQKWKEGERTMGTISIRVPSDSYDKAVSSLRALALDVTNETTSSQDVTQEYVDLDSRLKNLQATEDQLLKIMQTATKTQDILDIQREITNTRGQIEQIKGRMQYLERTSATSLIDIRLEQASLAVKMTSNKIKADTGEKVQFTGDVSGGFAPYSFEWTFGDGETSNVKAPAYAYNSPGTYTVTLKVTDNKGYTNTETRADYITVSGWSPGTTARTAWNGLVSFGKALAEIGIWLAIFAPLWLVIGGVILFLVRRNKRKNS